jgi:DUF1365 family protein
MESCIYEGVVRHRRFQPIEHQFTYSLFMMYLDLDELPGLFRGRWSWSVNRPALARFRREDHYGDPAIPLSGAIRDLVQEKTGARPSGPIRLLTHLRYFGYVFNPVSFYYCFDPDGKCVETIVAEVNNTPWGEQHCYVLDRSMNEAQGQRKRFRFRKDFHVSPFMGMNVDYDWRFVDPGRGLFVHMENLESGRRIFDASMTLRRRPIGGRSLAGVLIRYPLMTLRIIAAIHYQAMLLKFKGAPFFIHPSFHANKLEARQS